MVDLRAEILARLKVFPLISVEDIRSLRKEYGLTRSEVNSIKEYCRLEAITLRDGETYWADSIQIKEKSKEWGG